MPWSEQQLRQHARGSKEIELTKKKKHEKNMKERELKKNEEIRGSLYKKVGGTGVVKL